MRHRTGKRPRDGPADEPGWRYASDDVVVEVLDGLTQHAAFTRLFDLARGLQVETKPDGNAGGTADELAAGVLGLGRYFRALPGQFG